MSDSKGKGRANPSKEAEAPPSTPVNTISNLLNNVASSATGLAKSALGAPTSNELSNAFSSAPLGAGKVQPSSSTAGSAVWAESSKPIAGSSSSYVQAQNAQPQGLRNHHDQHALAAEAEFSSFLDSVPVLETALPSSEAVPQSGQQTPGSYAGTGTDYPHPSSLPIHHTPPTTANGYKTVEEAQAHDGADVLAILATFNREEKDYFEPQTIEAEIEEWRLTPEQVALAGNLAAELHVPETDNWGALVPKAFRDGEKEEYLPEEYARDSYGYLGEVVPPEEAKGRWMEMWEEVLNRYQDEVWGGMLPLVKKAKQELEEAKIEGTEDRQPKALRRLGMVLSHISNTSPHQPAEPPAAPTVK